MSVGSNVQRLAVVPDAEESDSPLGRVSSAAGEPVVCSFCFGTGMEVVPGKGARRCRCRAENARKRLLEAHASRAVTRDAHSATISPGQTTALNSAHSITHSVWRANTLRLIADFFSWGRAASERRICRSPSCVS